MKMKYLSLLWAEMQMNKIKIAITTIIILCIHQYIFADENSEVIKKNYTIINEEMNYSANNQKENNNYLTEPYIVVHSEPHLPIPTAVVSVVYKVGKVDSSINKNGIIEIIVENFVNRKLHKQFQQIGIEYNTICTSAYTAINARMHPKYLSNFFDLIKKETESFSLDNQTLELCKRKIILQKKLISYNRYNSVSDNIFALTHPQIIFNEGILKTITVEDVKTYFNNNFKNNIKLIIISGNFENFANEKFITFLKNNIENKNHFSDVINVPQKNSLTNNKDKFINLENEHEQNSITYVYTVSEEEDRKTAPAFMRILEYELFKQFQMVYQKLSYCYGDFFIRCSNSDIINVSLYPKKDVSQQEIKKLYNLFVEKISSVAIDEKTISEIADREKISENVYKYDMVKINEQIIEKYFSKINIETPLSEIIRKSSPERIKNFAHKIMCEQSKFEINTKYRSDK